MRPPPGIVARWSALWTVVVVSVGGALGALERAWLIAHHPLFGDEAVVGLMARQIAAGHFFIFYWGQHYGGLEPYVVAAGHPQVWLFFSPGRLVQAAAAFSNPSPGPGGMTEGDFEAWLAAKGITFHVTRLGVLDAITTQQAPTP